MTCYSKFPFYCVTALTPGRQSSLPVLARMFDKVNLAYRNYSLEAEQVAQQVSPVYKVTL